MQTLSESQSVEVRGRTDQHQIDQSALISHLCQRIPKLLAIYAFGSRIRGLHGQNSDLDLAVLVEGYAAPLLLWEVSAELAEISGYEVDLLDFRAASTVMQYQILTTGTRWWAADAQAALYETAILSEKLALDTARAGLIADIEQRGRIHGR